MSNSFVYKFRARIRRGIKLECEALPSTRTKATEVPIQTFSLAFFCSPLDRSEDTTCSNSYVSISQKWKLNVPVSNTISPSVARHNEPTQKLNNFCDEREKKKPDKTLRWPPGWRMLRAVTKRKGEQSRSRVDRQMPRSCS